MTVLRKRAILLLCLLLFITGVQTQSFSYYALAEGSLPSEADIAPTASITIEDDEATLQNHEELTISELKVTELSECEVIQIQDEAVVSESAVIDTESFNEEHVTGDWIIKWNSEQRDKALYENSIVVQEDPELNITVARPSSHADLNQWVQQWSSSKAVQYIEPNQKVSVSAKPNDELYRFQRNLNLIGAELAWDKVTSNTGITIAFIDTGVDLDHPDLKDSLVKGTNLLDSKGTPKDDHGHGTNVAGIIAANGNNSIGITGLLWKSKLMPIKALGSDGSGDEATLGRGIRYAVDNGAKIVVLSLGLYKYSNFMQEVVNYAEEKGVLLVAASGNDGKDVKYPAAYPSVLAVGGIQQDKTIERKSNYGPELDIVAPWMVFTTARNNGYDYNEGTSMAAPQVAAVAAMIWAQNPQYKPYQIRNQLRLSAEDIGTPGWDEQTGYGLLRADRALSMTYQEDIYKPNATRNQAKPLTIDTMISASIMGGRDTSWFALQAPYNGEVILTFNTDRASDLSMLEVWYHKPGGSPLRYTDLSKPLRLDVSKGTSHIQIQAKDRSETRNVHFRLTTGFLIYKDAFADNHRQYLAYVLPKGIRTLTGTFHQLNEQDWYVYTVEAPGTLQFSVSTNTNRMDLGLLVQREGERSAFFDYGEEGETEYSTVYDVFPGKYYVRITNESISKESHPVVGEYTLTIDYKEKLIDPNEPNNKSYQATTVSLNTTYRGLIDTADDVDWFGFRIDTQSYVTLQLKNIPSDRVMTVVLSDNIQAQKASQSNRAGTTSIAMNQMLPKGNYYIKLTANKPFQNSMYQLEVNAEPIVDGYRDIANSWARNEIVDLTRKDIIKGYSDYTFRPKLNVTRAEATEMLVRALKLTDTSQTVFTDMKKSHWAYDSVLKATKAGIITGYNDGTFRPDQRISRAEMATLLARAMNWTGTAGSAPFSDVPANHWASQYILELKNKGWLNGYADGSFRPDQRATREEFASLVYRVVNGKR